MRIISAAFPNVCLFCSIESLNRWLPPPAQCKFGAAEGRSFHIGKNGNDAVAIGVTGKPFYLALDGKGVGQGMSASGGGYASFQLALVQPLQQFRLVPQQDGTTAIASVAFPGVYLRMDGNGLSAANPGAIGVVNGQYGVGPLEKFLFVEDTIKSNWSTRLDKVRPSFASCLAVGQVWQATNDALQGVDQITGAPTRRIAFGRNSQTPRAVAPRDDGLVVFCDDHALYQVSLDPARAGPPARVIGGEPVGGWGEPWLRPFGTSIYVGETRNGIQRIPPQEEIDRQGLSAWDAPYGRGLNIGVPSFIDNSAHGTMLTPTVNNTLNAVDPRAMIDLWSVRLPGRASARETACNGDFIFLIFDDAKICAISLQARQQAWKLEFDSPIVGSPTCDANYCYVALAAGSVLALSVVDGAVVGRWPLSLVGGSGVLNENGVVYSSVRQAGDGDFAIAASTAKSSFYEEVERPLASYPIAIDNGVLYAADDQSVFAVRPSSVLGQFYAESTLMQDFDFSEPEPVKIPWIHNEITVFAKNGAPQANQAVQISAERRAEIKVDGQPPQSIGPNSSIVASTDAMGKIRIALRAGEQKEGALQEGLACPELILFTSFMDSGHTIRIRPDGQLHETLAMISQAGLADAKSYDGKPMIAPAYRTDDKLKVITQTMNKSLGVVKDSVIARHEQQPAPDAYCATGCDRTVICCCETSKAKCPVVCKEAFSFSLGERSLSFASNLSKAQIDAWKAAHPETTELNRRARRDFGDVADFLWDSIKSGVGKVKDALVYAADLVSTTAQSLVTAVIDGIEYTISVALDGIEKVVAIAQGVFNTVAQSIGKVLEALSLALEWGHILEVKKMITEKLDQGWEAVLGKDGKGGYFDQAKDAIDLQFKTLKAEAASFFSGLRAKLKENPGVASIGGEQNKAENGKNPARGGSKTNWLQSKFQQNLGAAPASFSASSRSTRDALPIEIPQFQIPCRPDRRRHGAC